MTTSAAAVSQPANTKSAKNGADEIPAPPPDPEWFVGGVLTDGLLSPVIIGSSAERTMQVGGRFRMGTLDGLIVEARMLLPGIALAFKIEQQTPGVRKAGSYGYAIVWGNGFVSVVRQ